MGEGEAQRRVDAGEAGERANRQHGGDGHERVAQRPDRLAVSLEQAARRHVSVVLEPAVSLRLPNAGHSQSVSGCQILRKPIRQAIDTSEAPISTNQGLTKLEIRNCGTAKETPVTRMAGQISFMPLKP